MIIARQFLTNISSDIILLWALLKKYITIFNIGIGIGIFVYKKIKCDNLDQCQRMQISNIIKIGTKIKINILDSQLLQSYITQHNIMRMCVCTR